MFRVYESKTRNETKKGRKLSWLLEENIRRVKSLSPLLLNSLSSSREPTVRTTCGAVSVIHWRKK